ncbi:MAG: endolytic transglycosylase MltG [Treponema sp.]|jgi:UPF0755 protein|nr:endolytic transglycosylase MltG [Treponema sp.]
MKRPFNLMLFILKVIMIFVVLIVAGAGLGIGTMVYLNNPPDKLPEGADDDGSILFEVRGGESARSVGSRLQSAGIIKSRHLWNFLARFKTDYIKAGTYRIELPASQDAIYQQLIEGKEEQALVKVTIPEGVTLKKMAHILEDAGICDADAFLEIARNKAILDAYQIPGNTMEGFLYPDTYFFTTDYPVDMVIKTMADTFFKRIAELEDRDPEAAPLTPKDIYEKVIIASIVEREYRVDEEAPLMAGVFFNRLRIDMALQSCATVEYVITEIQGKPHPTVIYNRDTEIDNPYNTYVYDGLPPGPISAPGAVALNAAFYPVTSDYLYFRLVDANAGAHFFSKTLNDHIKAGTLYVKRGPSS